MVLNVEMWNLAGPCMRRSSGLSERNAAREGRERAFAMTTFLPTFQCSSPAEDSSASEPSSQSLVKKLGAMSRGEEGENLLVAQTLVHRGTFGPDR